MRNFWGPPFIHSCEEFTLILVHDPRKTIKINIEIKQERSVLSIIQDQNFMKKIKRMSDTINLPVVKGNSRNDVQVFGRFRSIQFRPQFTEAHWRFPVSPFNARINRCRKRRHFVFFSTYGLQILPGGRRSSGGHRS